MNPLISPYIGGGSGSGGAGVSGLDTADGGTAIADNAIIRGDGTTGIQGSGVLLNDSNQLVFEGTTADDFETTFGVTDPTADVTILLPNAAGTLTAGPTTTTSTGVVRWSGTTGGAVLNSGVTIDGSDVVSGATQLNVDNVRIDGNTVSITESNGNLTIASNGTGYIDFDGPGSFTARLASNGFYPITNDQIDLGFAGGGFSWKSLQVTGAVNFDTASNIVAGLTDYATGVIKATDGSTGIRGFLGGGTAVASATAMPLPTGRVFHVTGTTAITSITATNLQAGVVITLIFDDVLTFTDGNNLKLAGNFVTSADDTITLAYDGTNFYECSRSVN